MKNESIGHEWRAGRLLALGGLVATAWTGTAAAQDVPLGPPKGFEQPSGIKLGPFDFIARTLAGLNGTSNVRSDPSEKADVRSVSYSAAALRSNWEHESVAATVGYLDKRAFEISDEVSTALSYSLSGEAELFEGFKARGGYLHTENVVSENSPEQFAGNLNGTTSTVTREGGLSWTAKPFFANLEGRLLKVTNDTNIDTTVLTRLQQQDREERDATLQFGLDRSWGKFYGLIGGQAAHYTGSPFILPENRDSRGTRIGFGIETSGPKLSVIFRLIWLNQGFKAATIPDVNTAIGTLQARYALDDEMALAGKVERSFDEINITGSGGVFTNEVSLGFQHHVLPKVYYQLGPTFKYYTIAGTNLSAHSEQFDALVAYQVQPRVELTLSGSFLFQYVSDASLSTLQYTDQQLTVSTVITF